MESRFEADVKEATWGWWLLVLVGVLSIVAGVIILFKPSESLATLAVIAGIFLLLDGILELVDSFLQRHQQPRPGRLDRGPQRDRRGAADPPPGRRRHRGRVLIGIWLIAVGVIRFATAFEEYEHRGWHALAGLVELIAGIVIVANPRHRLRDPCAAGRHRIHSERRLDGRSRLGHARS